MFPSSHLTESPHIPWVEPCSLNCKFSEFQFLEYITWHKLVAFESGKVYLTCSARLRSKGERLEEDLEEERKQRKTREEKRRKVKMRKQHHRPHNCPALPALPLILQGLHECYLL